MFGKFCKGSIYLLYQSQAINNNHNEDKEFGTDGNSGEY